MAGAPLLFTARTNDYYLDIYSWDADKSRFVFSQSIPSQDKSSRMAGQPIAYGGKTYIPTQYCEKVYGGGVVIKEVLPDGNTFSFKVVKRLESPHPKRRIRMHTLNVYKGVAIIDVGGYDYPWFGKLMLTLGRLWKRISKAKS